MTMGRAFAQQLQPGGQRPALAHEDPESLLELVRTVTASNLRATLFDSQAEQLAFNPSEYAEIDARISNDSPQSSQT
jgi:hypothetical protein